MPEHNLPFDIQQQGHTSNSGNASNCKDASKSRDANNKQQQGCKTVRDANSGKSIINVDTYI